MPLTQKQFLEELGSRLREEGIGDNDEITSENSEKVRGECDTLVDDVENGDWDDDDEEEDAGSDTEE